MRRLADRFGEAASNCSSLAELRALIDDASGDLGFEYFALLHHASLGTGAKQYVRIDNYPAEWVAELVDGGLAPHDPVHLACRRASSAFRWTDLDRLIPLGRQQRSILWRSRRFGLGEGLTVPVNVPGEPAGSCSFAVRRGAEFPDQRRLCAELVGAHAFAAARRLAKLPAARVRPHLSRRELQCLRLVAAGKTDWEAARILGISVETARQYLKRARSAYDAVTRAQLVVLGLRDDWLSFDEALDPRVGRVGGSPNIPPYG
jgi:LuxR family quorum-sensing system transcriptional regulator CciR